MKKTLLILSVFSLFTWNALAQERRIETTELPPASREYIQQHFPNQNISVAVKASEGMSHTFEVILSDQTKIEFDKKGKASSISSKSKLPDSVIPTSILNYIKTNYSDSYVKQLETDKGKQEVELNNGVDLKFSKKGKFIGIDL